MAYKTIIAGGHDPEHGEWEVYYVVPDHVTGQMVMYSPEDAEVFCECYEKENADLIVSFLNREARH